MQYTQVVLALLGFTNVTEASQYGPNGYLKSSYWNAIDYSHPRAYSSDEVEHQMTIR